MVLRDEGQGKSRVRALNFRKANFQLFEDGVSRTPGILPSGTGERNRAGRSFRTLSTERRSSRSLGVRNQGRKARDQHG